MYSCCLSDWICDFLLLLEVEVEGEKSVSRKFRLNECS